MVNIYTVFRTTQDIDFAVDIESEGIMVEEYVSYLKEGNFNPLQDWKTAIEFAKKNKMLQYFNKSNYVKFDNYLIDIPNNQNSNIFLYTKLNLTFNACTNCAFIINPYLELL